MSSPSPRRLAALDRFWDALVSGTSHDDDLAPDTAAAVRQVHREVSAPEPDPTFLTTLLEDLMHTHASSVSPAAWRTPFVSQPRRDLPHASSSRTAPARVRFGALATAACILLVAAAAVAAVVLRGEGGEQRVVLPAAQLAATAQAGEPVTTTVLACAVEPRTLDEMVALLTGGSAGGLPVVPPPVVPDRHLAGIGQGLPDGPAPDAATVATVLATWGQYFGCMFADDPLRLNALLSDAAVLRAYYPNGGINIPQIILLDREPDPNRFGIDVGDPAPGALLDFRMIGDDRVGAYVASSTDGTASGYVVFVREGGRWLVDDIFALRG